MKPLNKPTLLLWLPVVVWAATFTYAIGLYFMVDDEISGYAIETKLGVGPLIALLINVLTFFMCLIAMSVYPEKEKSFLYRLLLVLTNSITPAIFNSLIPI